MRITCDHCGHRGDADQFPVGEGAWYCPRCEHDESALLIEHCIIVETAMHPLDAASLALNTDAVLKVHRSIGKQVWSAAVTKFAHGRYEVVLNPTEVPPGAEVFDIEQMLAY